MRRPLIGITIGANPEEYMSYAEAVEQAGGNYEFLSHADGIAPERLAEILGRIDGLLLSGGRDIHPDNYASRNEPGDEDLSADALIGKYRMSCDPKRDAFELPLTRAAYVRGIPILGICRGFQVFNVALGGSLVKDIRTSKRHRAYTKDDEQEGHPAGQSESHPIEILQDSRLFEAVGPALTIVNSRHHQGVTARQRSGRLRPVAFTPDGLIEGLEGVDHRWAVAVQWHPERAVDTYVHEPCRALFAAFIEAARS